MSSNNEKKNGDRIAVVLDPSFFLFLPGGLRDLPGAIQKTRNAKTVYIGPQGFDAIYPWAQIGSKPPRADESKRVSQFPLRWYSTDLSSYRTDMDDDSNE
ncbi:MAG: hypothetical protein GY854_13795 [Deltaproteobacteria bacterium]|nr:hypothetical protein [Deltaproteobacteria bacterium]